MTTSEIKHSTFVIERELPGGPKHAFRFWSEPALKKLWTGCHPDWTVLEDRFDFGIGGEEAIRWRTPEGHAAEARGADRPLRARPLGRCWSRRRSGGWCLAGRLGDQAAPARLTPLGFPPEGNQ